MAFLDLDDRSGRIQLQAKLDVLGPERFERLLELDLGDLLGVDGVAFRSRKGELTLRVEDFTVLAKSLRPPPDKHHGLHDVETRFRRRELDLMANAEARELFVTRARVITEVRRYLDTLRTVAAAAAAVEASGGRLEASRITSMRPPLSGRVRRGNRRQRYRRARSSWARQRQG
jgi:lysyl-tRNA synthetase class 2